MTSKFTLKIAGDNDTDAINQCLAASYSKLMAPSYNSEILANALPLMTRANPVLIATGRYYIVNTETKNHTGDTSEFLTVGCGGWSLERPGTGEIVPGVGHIRHFATHPDWTGQGIGRLIFAQSRITAKDEGLSRFECYSSLNAEIFYTALGFSKVHRIGIRMAEDLVFPSLLMACAL